MPCDFFSFMVLKYLESWNKYGEEILSDFKNSFNSFKCNKTMLRKNILELPIAGCSISFPFFFPSISSIKTNFSPLEYLKFLVTLKYPGFLISGYDVYYCDEEEKFHIFDLLEKALQLNQIILLDSGNYECYWNKDKIWSEERFVKILKRVKFNISFCFDFQKHTNDLEEIVSKIEKRVTYEQKFAEFGSIVPIVHAPKELLVEAIVEVTNRLHPIMVAVPERILGDGILERVDTLCRIRKTLDSSGIYYPLHLLGTGNALSILIYSIFGADSFDGLEWCQTTVDHETGLHYHFQQREFFEKQSPFCSATPIYSHATLAHNLDFYRYWMAEIKGAIEGNRLENFLVKHIPDHFVKKLRRQLPDLFI
jgi:queuine/archaeosine tRNA-ribosyltransferase